MLSSKLFLDARTPYLGCASKNIAPLIGAAAILGASSLIGGALSSSGQSSANSNNLKIAREQMKFNAEEAQKNRDWQEQYYEKYSSPVALASQYRAAGLNTQLSNLTPGSVASGSTASYSSLPTQQNEMSGIASGIQNAGTQAASMMFNQQSVTSQVELNKSIENLNSAQETLQTAMASESTQRISNMKMDLNYLQATFDSRVKEAYNEAQLSAWRNMDGEFQARSQMFQYYNILPEQQAVLQKQSLSFAASAFKSFADGKLTLKQCDNYMREMAIRQTQAYAQTQMARAAVLNAQNQGSYLSHLSNQVDAQTGALNRQNMVFDAPVMHNGKLTKSGVALQYLFYSQNRSALTNSLLNPSLVRSQIGVNETLQGLNKSQTVRNYTEAVTGGFKNVLQGVGSLY